ncbi:hypothetical protein [Coxiella endosymbiont of Ornithodoros amblus]|uniref:hypothetical protein n=1 Tax=Coxiella endosymbiont of Ornithodoros amblus TaxID=1656166 RepID=UPI00244DC8A2|nr:hypothetical protein [Coxiella endosymbiont of Ornithodoros amblus]
MDSYRPQLFTYLSIHEHWIYGFLFFLIGIAASGQKIEFTIISEHSSLTTRVSGLGLKNVMIFYWALVHTPLINLFIEGSHGALDRQ